MSSLAGLAANTAAVGATVGVTRLLLQSEPAVIGEVTLDASVREIHTASARVTSHPVEATQGQSEISDHVHVAPLQLSIDGVITNTPVIFAAAIQTAFGGGSFDPAGDAYAVLSKYLAKGQLITVQTSLKKDYKNMILQSFNVTRDASKGNSLHFSASLQQIRIVESEETPLNQSKPPEQTTKDTGKVEKAPASSAQEATGKSVIQQFIGWVGGIFQ